MRCIVVIPTYNERSTIREVVEKVFHAVPEMHVLVVDDNSPDGTGAIADQLAQDHPARLFVLHRPSKEGLGRAYIAGFQRALDDGYDIILQMDADLSHDPAYIPAFLQKIQDADLVLGSRYLRGISVVHWDLKRLILSKAANRYVQLVAGIPITDATGGFKCWRSGALRAVGLESVRSVGYIFQVEMTYRALKLGFRVEEVPIIFYERNLGRSKMSGRVVFEAVWGVWRLRFRRLGPAKGARAGN